MTITKTIADAGADFATLNLWVSWVQANAVSAGNLTDNVEGRILKAGYTAAATQTVSGWAPGGSNFTTKITANPGDGFRDNANVQTNAYYYNSANGAFMDFSGGAYQLILSVAALTVSNLQIDLGTLAYQFGVTFAGVSSGTTAWLANIVRDPTGTSHVSCIRGPAGGTFNYINNLLIYRNSAENKSGLESPGSSVTNNIYDNTFASTTGSGLGLVCDGYGQTQNVKGNAFYNFASGSDIQSPHATVAGSNNATTNSSWAGAGTGSLTASQFSILPATELVGGASYNDFRLKSTSTACKDNGVAITGVTDDAVGTSRPQGSAPDIGAWELVTGGGATRPVKMVGRWGGYAGASGGFAG